jgi:HEAT repeat protein
MEISQANSYDPAAPLPPTQAEGAERSLKSEYGTLGPHSDIAAENLISSRPVLKTRANHGWPVVAVAAAVVLAVLAVNVGKARASWSGLARFFSSHENLSPPPMDLSQLDRMPPQEQAETLLEMAVGNSQGAVDQIGQRSERWRGKIAWNSQIASLTSAALNSSDRGVRESGVNVELAAYGLAKNSSTVRFLANDAASSNHPKKVWALWSLGLMANRGVETGRAVEVLRAHLRDQDEDSRRWAVEGLALAGTTDTIPALLETMHDDASLLVRERAACSLAECGMLTHEQRLTAVPTLVNYSGDPSLDAQTQTWAFQALEDITQQRLPHDARAWRNWYAASQGR